MTKYSIYNNSTRIQIFTTNFVVKKDIIIISKPDFTKLLPINLTIHETDNNLRTKIFKISILPG